MVSRRNFFAMVTTMLILFFMFQFTGIAKNALNEYEQNEFTDLPSAGLNSQSMYSASSRLSAEEEPLGERPYILFAGGRDSGEIRSVVLWWCTYTKRGFEECEDITKYRIPAEGQPQAVVIDGKDLPLKQTLPVLKELAGRGVHLIFARLPEAAEMRKNPSFCEFIGIREIHQESVTISGVHLFSGFLLGAERIYETDPDEEELMDLDLEIPWYMTGEGTKTYMMGLLEEQGEYKNEMLPALIWRKSVKEAKVFCMNMDALSHMYGIGYLNAMMAETDVSEIFPVVNAQSLSIVNFSGFIDENDQRMKELYTQSQTSVYRELIWPMLVSLTEQSNLKMTLFAAPQTDYADSAEPDADRLTYYLKLLREEHGELAVSMDSVSTVSLSEKLSLDRQFYAQRAGNYEMLSLFVRKPEDMQELSGQQEFPRIRTVAAMSDGMLPAVSYLEADTTLQTITSKAEIHTYTDDLALMGVETALGYSNIALDLNLMADPESSDYYWENLSRDVTRNIFTYWKNYQCFTGTTMAESDARVRRFLALDYRVTKRDDGVVIQRNDMDGPVWFLLKVNGRDVKHMEGGTYEELTGGFYLIELEEQRAVIEFGEKRTSIHE